MVEVVYNVSCAALRCVICCPVSMQSDRALLLAIVIYLPHPECLSDNGVKVVYLTNFCLCSSSVD